MKALVLSENAKLRYLTFFYLYILQGIPAGFSLTALTNFMIAQNLSSEKVGTFIALAGFPWVLQFIWGPIIDRYQYSSMGNRKHWIVSMQLSTIFITGMLTFVISPVAQLSTLQIIFFLNSVASSVQVAAVDALAIIITPVDQRGKLNGFMRGGFLLGSATGATVFSILLHYYPFYIVSLAHTTLLSIFSAAFFFTKIHRTDTLLPIMLKKEQAKNNELNDNPSFKIVFKNVIKGITSQKSLQYVFLISVIYFCCSVFIRSYTYYLINVLKWQDSEVSLLQGGWGSLLTFTAILIAGRMSDKVGAKYFQIKVMWWTCIFLLLVNLTYSLWNYGGYSGTALILWNLVDPLLSVAIFPILMSLCLKQIEGSQFTTYLALINLCDVVGSYATGWSLNVIAAPILGLCCGLILFVTLLYIKYSKNYQVIPG